MPSPKTTTAALSTFFKQCFRARYSRRETAEQWRNRASREQRGGDRSPDLREERRDNIVQNPGYATPPPAYTLEQPSLTRAPPPPSPLQFALEPPPYSPGPSSAQHISSALTISRTNHTTLRPATARSEYQQDLTSVLERPRPQARRISIHALSTPLSIPGCLATEDIHPKHIDSREISSSAPALQTRSKVHRATRPCDVLSGDAAPRESYTVGAITLVRWVSEEGGVVD